MRYIYKCGNRTVASTSPRGTFSLIKVMLFISVGHTNANTKHTGRHIGSIQRRTEYRNGEASTQPTTLLWLLILLLLLSSSACLRVFQLALLSTSTHALFLWFFATSLGNSGTPCSWYAQSVSLSIAPELQPDMWLMNTLYKRKKSAHERTRATRQFHKSILIYYLGPCCRYSRCNILVDDIASMFFVAVNVRHSFILAEWCLDAGAQGEFGQKIRRRILSSASSSTQNDKSQIWCRDVAQRRNNEKRTSTKMLRVNT